MTHYIFMGWDPRDDLAYKVAERSIRAHTKSDIEIIPLRDHELRRLGLYWRPYEVAEQGQMTDSKDGKPFSTGFSFSRFLVPKLAQIMGITNPILFVDPDILVCSDIAELFSLWECDKAVMCVQHDYAPVEQTKFDGMIQARYFRKNWSSVMLFNPDMGSAPSVYHVNNATGSFLHGMLWAADDKIGSLPHEWNHLVGYDEPNEKAKIYHYTLGTPDISGRTGDEHEREWWSYVKQNEVSSLAKLKHMSKAEISNWKAIA